MSNLSDQLLSELYWKCQPHGPETNHLALEIWQLLRDRSGSLIPADQGRVEELEASEALGSWLCAALDDENVCDEFKASITTWFEAGKPTLNYLDKIEELEAENARLKEALRPFAETLVAQVDVDLPQQDWRDEDYDTVVRIRTSHARRGLPDLSEDMTLAVGDFRNARATLSRKGEG